MEERRTEEDKTDGILVISDLSFLKWPLPQSVSLSLRQISSLETLNCKKYRMNVLGSII